MKCDFSQRIELSLLAACRWRVRGYVDAVVHQGVNPAHHQL
jgi:hypothetical protein